MTEAYKDFFILVNRYVAHGGAPAPRHDRHDDVMVHCTNSIALGVAKH
ncbi:hypothetical protein PX699_02945 [Sphingobium sp. H39-3-25]|nr:hypothetical protein [Sphingobium arseniciresistens]